MLISMYRLTLHDYLFYASREMGRLYETEKYLHNYGLAYALGLVTSSYSNLAQVPHYAEDLQRLNEQGVYVTPAHPERYTFTFHTFKMANVNYYNRSVQVSTNQVVFGRSKELAPESSFLFFVLSPQPVTLPRWIRLGKWMAKAQVEKLAQGEARVKRGDQQMSGALNPLDLQGVPSHCNIVAMAPASLITNVTLSGDYYESVLDEQKVCLPVKMRFYSV
jgi:CRISPR-associated protein Csc1